MSVLQGNGAYVFGRIELFYILADISARSPEGALCFHLKRYERGCKQQSFGYGRSVALGDIGCKAGIAPPGAAGKGARLYRAAVQKLARAHDNLGIVRNEYFFCAPIAQLRGGLARIG